MYFQLEFLQMDKYAQFIFGSNDSSIILYNPALNNEKTAFSLLTRRKPKRISEIDPSLHVLPWPREIGIANPSLFNHARLLLV